MYTVRSNLIIRNFPKAARLSQIKFLAGKSTFKNFFQGPDSQSTFLNPSVLIVLPTASRLKSHLPKILLRRGRIFCLCPARVLQTPYKAPLTTGKKPGRVFLQPNPLKKPLAAESYYAHWLRSSWSTWPMMTTMQASAHSWQVTAGSC